MRTPRFSSVFERRGRPRPNRTPASLWLALGMLWAVQPLTASAATADVGAKAAQQTRPLIEQATALLRDRAASYPGEAVIHVETPRLTQQTACDDLDMSLSGTGALQSRTTVRAHCLGPEPWTVYLHAKVKIMGAYFVSNRLIQRGETLMLDDLDTREGDLLRHKRYITDPAHLIHWMATRRIPAGTPIPSNALRSPDAIRRGSHVRTIVHGAGFVATSEGQALQPGSPGAQIQVRTPNGKIISGIVMDAHTVRVAS